MTRRSESHDYTRPGIYHITLHVAEGLGQPLGQVVGADVTAAAVALSPVGEAVKHELLTAITAHYPMVMVDAYVIMPEHLHFLLMVSAPLVGRNGNATHLGQVIAGFKKGCNRAFWGVTGQESPVSPAGEPLVTVRGGSPAAPLGSSARRRAPWNGTSGRPSLFCEGYCDVMPITAEQLETQRTYILDNPRSRWLRTHYRDRLQPRRGGIDTALTPAALCGFLPRECPQHLVAPDALAQITGRLLLNGGKIDCDTYGDRTLLQRQLLPVVCHRRDKSRFADQKARCLKAAEQGAVLLSARIASGEQDILDTSIHNGFPVVMIADNGFPDRYHPSAERIALCAEGRLLLITPWQYQYRGKQEQVTVPHCKAMNCVAQALCRLKDDWWQIQSPR